MSINKYENRMYMKSLYKIKILKFVVEILSLNDFSTILVEGLFRNLGLLA